VTFAEIAPEIEDEYRRRTPRSRALHEQAAAVLPGGDTRSGTHFQPYPAYIDAGRGPYLVDVDGNELLDFTFNSTSQIHGYAHPAIVEAIQDQAHRGTAWNAPNTSLLDLARLLCTRIPSLEQLRFCNSGTEANMQAVKAARAFTGRDRILKMDGAYHGTYEGVEVNRTGPAAGVPRNAADNVLLASFDDAEAATLIEAHRNELAAVVVTPVQTRPALGLPRSGYLELLREVTRAHEVLLIFDEVISLRVSAGGAQEHLGVTPDLTAMGKIIGGGLPVGAFGGRADVMRVFADTGPRSAAHAGTFNGNPLTAAAGLVAMQLLTPNAYDQLARLGERLSAGLAQSVVRQGVALDVTSIASLVSLDLSSELRPDPTSAAAAAELLRLLQLSLMNRGIKTAHLLAVSTVTNAAQVDRLVEAVDAVLATFRPALAASAPALLQRIPQPV
jgi:glutamate-1-semialdehyde 2,1-aminomutase